MCGRYGFTDPTKLKKRYKLTNNINNLEPNYNVAPSQTMPVILNVKNHNEAELMKWGLIPSWAKDKKFAPINARDDSVAKNAMFKGPFKYKRCLIPANYFFEWQKKENGKTAYLIQLKDHAIFSFAGLYEENDNLENQTIKTFTIITTSPNSLMKPIHNRMPVIIKPEEENKWLDPNLQESKLLEKFLKPFSSNLMQAYPVSSLVNDPKNNFFEITKPI